MNKKIDKKERFKKIAPKRVESIIKSISLLSNCSNKYNYEYTKEDVDKIFRAINDELNLCKSKFRSQNKEKLKFEL
jgi:hypothetical protein